MNPQDPQAFPSNSVPAATPREPSDVGRSVLAMPKLRAKRPPPSTRCPSCGHAELSSLATFSAGSGVATRPFAEDIFCHGCGFIGMPDLIVP